MKKVKVNWDTDSVNPVEYNLPSEVEVPSNVTEENVADWLSDEYGFCVESWFYNN